MRFLISLFIGVFIFVPAFADEPSELKKLRSIDATRDWQGVGRVNIGQTGFCTGTLIAADIVLTAAHCFYNTKTKIRVQTDDIEFLAGFRGGRASAYRNVKRVLIHPDYVFDENQNNERVSKDLALMQLDHPIRQPSIKPFQTGTKASLGQEVQVISYAKDRDDAPSIQETCHVISNNFGVYVTSCDVDFGSSGSPIFVIEDGQPKVLSVVAAKAVWRSQKVALAAGLDNRLNLLLEQIEGNDGVFRRAEDTSKRIKPGESERGTGALFIKP